MRVSLVVAALALAACELPESDGTRSARSHLHFDPGPAFETVCKCVEAQGTCNADCTITCSPGFADCNNDVADGCEASLNDPITCGACDQDCTECNDHAMCNAGHCSGKQLPNGSACQSKICPKTSPGALCSAGQCVCADEVDMALPPAFGPAPDMAHGHDLPGDCSFTGGGTATATMMLLLGVVVLLNRRRRTR